MNLSRRMSGLAPLALLLAGLTAWLGGVLPSGAAVPGVQKTVAKPGQKTVARSAATLRAAKVAPRPAPHASAKLTYSPASAISKSDKPAPTKSAARQRAVREAAVPRYKTDAAGATVPDLHAAAAIIYNPQTHQVLWEEHSQDKRSIASITKVMTAVVCIESDPDLSQVVTVGRTDTLAASTTYLRAGYQVSVRDLMHLLLISSDNAAARTLARVSPWGPAGFVARMNEKALELGLQSTTYADPSGLDADNVSSAYDMARLIAYASSDERLSAIMRKPEYKVTLTSRPITIHSTNQLLSRPDMEGNVLGAKTGFIGRSGYCLATLLKMPQINQPVAVVVLGARTSAARFTEVRNLITWMTTRAQDLIGKNESEPQGRH
jgi:serine-type D-Ala-D-Ala endopeptidase (penicillin-binding protein 7)